MFESEGAAGDPPGILESVPDRLRRQLPDEVIDQLLAGARSEVEIVGPPSGGKAEPALLQRVNQTLREATCLAADNDT